MPVVPQRADRAASARAGGTSPNGWNKFIAARLRHAPRGTTRGTSCSGRASTRCRTNEMSFLLPHFLERRPRPARRLLHPRLQPGLDQPRRLQLDGGAARRDTVGCHVALTPTWTETAAFADYVLPMGHATERHDTHSYETHAGRWLGFRQPVRRVALEQLGPRRSPTPATPTRARCGRRTSSGSSCPGASTPTARSASAGTSSRRTGRARRSPSTSTTAGSSRTGARAAREGGGRGADAAGVHAQVRRRRGRQGRLPPGRAAVDRRRARRCRRRTSDGVLRKPTDDESTPPLVGRGRRGRRTSGGRVDASPAGSRRRASSSCTRRRMARLGLARARDARLHPQPRRTARARPRRGRDGAAADVPAADPDPHPLGQREVPQRDLQHAPALDPPRGRRAHGRETGDLVRVTTEIGYFVARVWVTEGIRPGVVALSHHMGRWRLHDERRAAAG